MTPYQRTEHDLAVRLSTAGVRHFAAWELLTLGGSHSTPGTRGYGKNSYPPPSKVANIVPAALALDLARRELGSPVIVTCAYRNPAYNRAVGGASSSFHMSNHAIDCYPADRSRLREFASILDDLRRANVWRGGLGKSYKTFVHVDCGTARNRTW